LSEAEGPAGPADRPARLRIRVTGTVQGVGFRPFVYRTALELGLAGHVLNDDRGVLIEAEGTSAALDELLRALREAPPPLADVEAVEIEPGIASGESGFQIVASDAGGEPDAQVAADMATCDACLAEVLDPSDRRYRYPFINCTDCGPRFTIVRDVPYDRPLTTMAGFAMCDACRAEYANPLDRRFHAQPNACPLCGPQATLLDGSGTPVAGTDGLDVVAHAARMLAGGSILAVKGIGGYHLACDAANEAAVASLRSRKRREDKPFALMAPGLDSARELVELSEAEETMLVGRERPIVIARRHEGAKVANAVAPRSQDLGVMLPHAPLQHILLGDARRTLVMTSANVSDEPIAYVDADARARLGGIADAFLVHDRPIHMRTDDSVVRATRDGPLMLRRSRGFVPRPTPLPAEAPAILGCGAELKSAFCLARGRRAWTSHHIGDLKNWETLESYREAVEHFERLFAVSPGVIAHDLHPDYLSTRYAHERAESEDLALAGVQHHHAHLAACLAEHGELGPVVGAIFDGTGYGPDGTVWGGELLAGGMADSKRVGMLMPVRLPGGDRAVQEPWRMAAAWISHAFDEELPAIPRRLRSQVARSEWQAVCRIARSGVGSPVTTSAGRLFDAVAAICGLRASVNYEGQAAAELEGRADLAETGAYDVALEGGETDTPLLLDPRSAVRAIVSDLDGDAEVATVAARFHNGLARATAAALARECERAGADAAVLSGGVFQNRLLAERTSASLQSTGLRVLMPRALPPNDGGVAYGQVAAVAARMA
jgi:hydrogenase maturation protein HypF